MVAMRFGCGFRRGELLALHLASIQQREEHWVIADLVGKGGHVRTVPIPTWVKRHVDAWTAAAARAGIDKLAPHDLRRSCARLCHLAGGELGQIQFLLGHVSIQTTRTLPRVQAEAPDCRERPIGNRTRCRLTRTTARADASIRPARPHGGDLRATLSSCFVHLVQKT